MDQYYQILNKLLLKTWKQFLINRKQLLKQLLKILEGSSGGLEAHLKKVAMKQEQTGDARSKSESPSQPGEC